MYPRLDSSTGWFKAFPQFTIFSADFKMVLILDVLLLLLLSLLLPIPRAIGSAPEVPAIPCWHVGSAVKLVYF